jgi:hypothetical protein
VARKHSWSRQAERLATSGVKRKSASSAWYVRYTVRADLREGGTAACLPSDSGPSTIQSLCRWVGGIAAPLLLLMHAVVVSAQALGILVFEKE